jgi:hypothetical protein
MNLDNIDLQTLLINGHLECIRIIKESVQYNSDIMSHQSAARAIKQIEAAIEDLKEDSDL